MRGTTKQSPSNPTQYVVLHGSSHDGYPHGGRDLPTPQPFNRRERVAHTNHPSTDRWVVLRTVRLAPTPLFCVEVVDGFSNPTAEPATYPTHERARRAANRLYNQLTEEP